MSWQKVISFTDSWWIIVCPFGKYIQHSFFSYDINTLFLLCADTKVYNPAMYKTSHPSRLRTNALISMGLQKWCWILVTLTHQNHDWQGYSGKHICWNTFWPGYTHSSMVKKKVVDFLLSIKLHVIERIIFR